MGWSNYIIIPKLKLLIEVTREVADIKDYEISSIEKVIDEDNIEYVGHFDNDKDCTLDMGDVPIDRITIRDLSELYKRCDIVQNLAGIDIDKLFLFWLKKRDIEFTIESQHNIDLNEYYKEGYKKIER